MGCQWLRSQFYTGYHDPIEDTETQGPKQRECAVVGVQVWEATAKRHQTLHRGTALVFVRAEGYTLDHESVWPTYHQL